MKKQSKLILKAGAIVTILILLIIGFSGCIGEEPDVVLCGKVTYIPVEREWREYGIIRIDDGPLYSVFNIGGTEYEKLKYAFETNSTVSLVLYTGLHGYGVRDKTVVLVNCWCD
jgi:hypothetical protein